MNKAPLLLLCGVTGIACLVALPATQAAPLQHDKISRDAKWILHLDLDHLRKTQVGSFLINDLVRKKLEQKKPDLPFDFNLPLDKVHGVTAYGTDFEKGPEANGVLLVDADQKIHEVAVALLIQQAEAGKAGEGPVKQLKQEDTGVYSIDDEVFVSVQPGEHLILGKSLKQVERAREILRTKESTLSGTETFQQFPKASHAFFFLATAQGFSSNSSIPPQARILQMADAARLVLGEKAEHIFLDLSLQAKDPEVSNQIQMVLQGMVALLSLSQQENPDLLAIANTAKVNRTNHLVSVNLQVPIAKVIARIVEKTKIKDDASQEPAAEAGDETSSSPKS